ncbi:large ribosomal RNA subunit accumulation protein YCED homolog 2, chloroplastic-like isoform X1 [Lolium rigidum]|uniref:large ribosomal RNA subunit accumulation protein YCED homolog 2, chloroplastic-like isoform X1 n=1 Tax=Lolium rigidum TaxID=89674 RepID=UPI001F5DC27B|nr:large ribosomal RNA subunit accumulation protein YCED homolog 2, chloroplastic-like isoform X1 [Lolium rigidum]
MERACSPALRLLPNPITKQLPSSWSHGRCRSLAVHARLPTEDDYAAESPKRVQVTQVNTGILLPELECRAAHHTPSAAFMLSTQSLRRSRRRGTGTRQSLVSVGTSRGGGDEWSSEFDLTLRQLRLDDLIEDGQSDADVVVHLLVQQHSQFGMSIKGRVVTSFGKICDSCSTPYLTKIDDHFDITVLSSSRKDHSGMPEIGDNDPSVISVKPGTEIDIDSSIQETIRLAASAKSSCSEACEKSTVVWKSGGNQKRRYSQSWSKLLDLKRTLDKAPS